MRLGDWLYYRTAHGGHTQRTLGRRRACAASVTHPAELTISIKLKVVKPKSEHVKSVLSLLQHTTESEKLKNLRSTVGKCDETRCSVGPENSASAIHGAISRDRTTTGAWRGPGGPDRTATGTGTPNDPSAASRTRVHGTCTRGWSAHSETGRGTSAVRDVVAV
jgi:hypothetical protein